MIPSFNYFPNQLKISETIHRISLEKLTKDEKMFIEYNLFLTRLLNQYLNHQIYDYLNSKMNCLALAEQIKDFFKKLYQRYKIIVQIFLGQNLDQTILIASRSLWDKSYDTILQKQYSNQTSFALINIFFIYKQ
jgi:hypothetical protein